VRGGEVFVFLQVLWPDAGLAVTELLNGLGKLVGAGEVRKLGWQTGLLVLLVIIATWIDAWESLRGVRRARSSSRHQSQP